MGSPVHLFYCHHFDCFTAANRHKVKNTSTSHGGIMNTRDIPTDQWQPFLDSFSRLHQGEHLGIESIGASKGPRADLAHRPLLGIVALPDCGQGACIEIIAGPQTEPRTKTIQHPSLLSVTEREDG